jgi:hypothetical protein
MNFVLRPIFDQQKTRHTTYTLDEVAQLTGYDQERLRQAIDRDDLGTVSGMEELHISGIELERWWHSPINSCLTAPPNKRAY